MASDEKMMNEANLKQTAKEEDTSSPSRCSSIIGPPCVLWRDATLWIRSRIQKFVLHCSLHAAKYPLWYVCGITFLSLALVVVGFFTNFRLELDIEAILSPTGSQPAIHKEWVYSQDGFPNAIREVALLMHRHGDNVLTMEAMERVFLGVQTIRETEGYDDLCRQGTYVNFDGDVTCRLLSASAYFESPEDFNERIHNDQDLRQALSSYEFANGSPVYHDAILGNWEKDNTTGNLTFAQSFLVVAFLPDTEDADNFESKLFDRLANLRDDWLQEDEISGEDVLQMDMLSIYATQMEYQRAIEGDLYLIPVVAIMMSSFVALTFASFGYGHDNAKSRTSLGAASVWTILMSYLSGCGLMFLCGVPFTPITQILPFVVFGIGLDDTFIIINSYLRTDPNLEILDRIQLTMEEVAHSISLTTITTVFAFLLGLRSSLPGVQWLCLYAFVSIFIDFLYQITLFISFVVLDEQRIQANRRDICFWLPESQSQPPTVESTREEEEAGNAEEELDANHHHQQQQEAVEQENDNPESPKNATIVVVETSTADDDNAAAAVEDDTTTMMEEERRRRKMTRSSSIPERIMSWYADILLQPHVKAIVLFLFATLLGCCAYSTTLLKQEFKIGDFVPQDSYLKDVMYSLQNYASVVRPIAVYFRNVDQTNPFVQNQMIEYVNELESLPELSSIQVDHATAVDFPTSIGEGNNNSSGFSNHHQVKPFCWVRDFQQVADQLLISEDQPELAALIENLTFVEKLNFALSNPTIREVYGQDIIRDATSGNITASRCWLFLTDIDLNSVQDQIELLHSQRVIGSNQPINQNKAKGDWSFFFYDEALFYWEAYDVAVQELFFTIVSGVVALTIISIVLIPHWSAVCFVTPMIVVLYTNFLGTLQFFGLNINGIFYFCVLVSIGLLVDFLLHILMRYYETASTRKTRDERVKETLVTMGSSIMLGGVTTFLGVVPLCLSSTKIFMIVFKAFFAMVTLGLAHGLILLPVILSLVGPTTTGVMTRTHEIVVVAATDESKPDDDVQASIECGREESLVNCPTKGEGQQESSNNIIDRMEEVWAAPTTKPASYSDLSS